MIHKDIVGRIAGGTAGLAKRHTTRVARFVPWADRPDPGGPWQESRQILCALLRDVPDREARHLVELNASTLRWFVADSWTETKGRQWRIN